MEPNLQARAIKNYFTKAYGLVNPPASDRQIASIEAKLGCRLPASLRALYLICNGISYPYGDHPLLCIEGIPDETDAFREFAPVEKQKKYICFGYNEGIRHLAINIHTDSDIVSFDPSLRDDFCELGPDLITAYKNLEKRRSAALNEPLPPEEYWQPTHD